MRFILFIAFLVVFCTCSETSKPSASGKTAPEMLQKGMALAGQYCGTCHAVPKPETMPKESWKFTLAYMGLMLGIQDMTLLKGQSEIVMENILSRNDLLQAAGMLPKQAALQPEAWAAIKDYYISLSPDSVQMPDYPKHIREEISFLKAHVPAFQPPNAVLTLLKMDPQRGGFFVADAFSNHLAFMKTDRTLAFDVELPSPAVKLRPAKDGIDVLLIGDLMASQPGSKSGQLLHSAGKGSNLQAPRALLDALQRPCDMHFVDLNDDGKEEVLLCQFGDYSGRFSIFIPEKMRYREQILLEQPGAVSCAAQDFDSDGRTDIALLMGHARESLSVWYNKGNLAFERHSVVESPASFGYTTLETCDFNKDGRMDMLTVNGDNGDSDPYNTLKKEHGLRLYLNEGGRRFREAFFYPMFGAYAAKVGDLDLDGDLDIVAVAFHPDFGANKPEGFTILLNKGDDTFDLRSLPLSTEGRWMSMDMGDPDRDGDLDLVLGAGYIPVGMFVRHQQKFADWMQNGKALIYLENTLR